MSGAGSSASRAREAFAASGGVLRASEALRRGIGRGTLYAMRDAGDIERLSRGLYRLTDLPPLTDPDLAIVGARVPQGVVCLVSALAYHELTTEIPRRVDVALRRGGTPPRLDYPPLAIHWFSGEAFTAGVETHVTDGVRVRIYSAEKSVADCFKHRGRVGLDTALDALRAYLARPNANIDALMGMADVCRVARVMRPYAEALL